MKELYKEHCKEHSDEELMISFSQGNNTALEKLIDGYSTPLYRFIYRIIKDEGESQDLVQETFLRVYRNASQYNPEYPFKTWLYSIASHLAINILKSARRRRMLFFWDRTSQEQESDCPSEEAIMDSKKNPEEALDHQQTYERVNRAIQSLNPRQKIALTLHKMEGLSYKEIAKVMDISLNAVESLIFRARQKIQHEFKAEK